MAEARAHVFINGRVQGVNFRYYVRLEAHRKGLTGWVRNLYDGRVEAVYEGEEQAVREMVGWCEHGPPSARVDGLEVEWEEAQGDFADFKVRMTGRGG